MMGLCFGAVVLVGLAGGPDGYSTEKKPWMAEKAFRHVFFAVYEGLSNDGVQNEDVELFLHLESKTNKSLFVTNCPLCEATKQALRTYLKRPGYGSDGAPQPLFGAGLPDDQRERIRKSPIERAHVLQSLTKKWVGERLNSLNLSDAERQEILNKISVGVKMGATNLSQQRDKSYTVKYCPICDGALGACRLPSAPTKTRP